MALKGRALVVQYTAWDKSADAGATGDVGNHTLKLIRDGVLSDPTNTPAEVSAVGCPGVYRLSLTAAEMDADSVTVAGISSTAWVAIIPAHVSTQHPKAGPGGIEFTYALTETGTGTPIAGATVWATSDAAGNDVWASGLTDGDGEVVLMLDEGTWYIWRRKKGWVFENPDTEEIG